jgi:hypothetical protein
MMPVKWHSNFAFRVERSKKRIAEELNAANASQVSVAYQLAPVDTGALRDSIHTIEDADESSLRAVSIVDIEYGIYQEFGFIHWMNAMFVPPQPYWTPSFQLARHQLLNNLRTIFGRAMVEVSYGVTTLSNPETFVSR